MARRNWMFTIQPLERWLGLRSDELYSWDDVDDQLTGFFSDCLFIKCCGYQFEKGAESGIKHIQGYIEFTKPVRMTVVKAVLVCQFAHVDPRRGNRQQALAYVSKEETRQSGPYYYPTKEACASGQGARTDLVQLKEDLDAGLTLQEIAEAHFATFLRYNKGIEKYMRFKVTQRSAKTKVTVWIGPPGCGKTSSMLEDVGEGAYFKSPNNKWFDDYQGQKTVIFDDFSGAWFPRATLLQLLDAIPMLVESKGTFVRFVSPAIHITCNYCLAHWYKEQSGPLGALARRIDTLKVFDFWNELTRKAVFKTYMVEDAPYPASHTCFPSAWEHMTFT